MVRQHTPAPGTKPSAAHLKAPPLKTEDKWHSYMRNRDPFNRPTSVLTSFEKQLLGELKRERIGTRDHINEMDRRISYLERN